MKHVVLTMMGLLSMAVPSAEAQFGYKTNAGALTITEYLGPGGTVTIPSSIDGLPVRGIGAEAFFEADGITNVLISEGVTGIGDDAFAACADLSTVEIPASVTNIGQSAFGSCVSLTGISVDPLNPSYSSLSGVLFNRTQTTLIQFPGGLGGAYAIPSGVVTLETNAFQNCEELETVVVPESVTNIEQAAFQGCSDLTNLTIPDTITTITAQAFANCAMLATVTIPAGVTSVGFQAFAGCGLTSLTIPSGVRSIGQQAFEGCSALAQVTIPATVTNIGQRAFGYCADLVSLTVDPGNRSYSSLGGVLFDKGQTLLLQYPGGLAGRYAVPASVTSIGDFSFAWCGQLTGVTLPQGLLTIGESAFYNCLTLASITIPSSVTSIEDEPLYGDAFYGCTALSVVLFQGNAPPVGSAEFSGDTNATIYYLPGTSGWGVSFGGRPTAPLDPPNPAGSLRVTITPIAAVSAGARWQVDDGPWQTAGATVANLSVGRHQVSFAPVAGWTPPATIAVSVRTKSTSRSSGAYYFSCRGIYNGLFCPASGVAEENSGMIKGLAVSSKGAYSGRLLIAGASYSFAGSFDTSGHAANRIPRAIKVGGPLTIALNLNWNDSPPTLTGTVSGGNWMATATNDLAASNASGEFTMSMTPAERSQSDGYLLITNHAGSVTISGALADGTTFNQTVPISTSGEVPVYASLYNNTGLVMGWLDLASAAPSGSLAWTREASHWTLYPTGFTNAEAVVGSRWTPPPRGASAIDLPAGQLSIDGGNLASALEFNVALLTNNILTKLAHSPTNSLTGSVNTKTGLLTLTFGNGAGRAVTVGRGVILQSETNAAGFFLGKTNSGSFVLQPSFAN